jgi:hypothetical protein
LRRFLLAGAFVVFATGSSSLVHATVYNVATDFSIAANPNGVWTYGFEATIGGAFTAFPTGNGYHCCGGPLLAWGDSGGTVAAEFYNPSAGSANLFAQANAPVGPGQAGLYPGVTNEAYAVFRFTAPANNLYSLAGAFSGLDTVGTTTDVHIVLDSLCPASVCLFDNTISPTGNSKSFSIAINLTAGDTLDFIVGSGGNGNANDATALAATITPAPEPATWAITGLGAIVVFVARRRSRKRAA